MTSETMGTVLLVGIVAAAGGLALIGLNMDPVTTASADVDHAPVREDPTSTAWIGEAVLIERASVPVLQLTTNGTTYHVDVQDDVELLITCPSSGGWTLHDADQTLAWSAMPACSNEATTIPSATNGDDEGTEEDCEENVDIIVQGGAAGVVWTTCD